MIASDPRPIPLLTTPRHLPMRVRLVEPLGDEALFDFCRLNPDLRIERTSDGELWIMPPTGGETGRMNFALVVQLGVWAERNGTGIGFDSSTGFVLPNGAERSPDAAWVTNERWSALSAAERTRFPRLCPDFVAELRSPTDEIGDAHEKMREYVANGLRLGWLLDPGPRTVWAYHADGAVERHDQAVSVTGDPVLPGFVLDLRKIWG